RGIYVSLAPSNTIGGTTLNSGNVASGNTTNGIEVSQANANQVLGNVVGTNAAGSAAVANGLHGIQVRTSNNVAVGGVGGGNLVSGNAGNGIDVTDSSDATQIIGNKV